MQRKRLAHLARAIVVATTVTASVAFAQHIDMETGIGDWIGTDGVAAWGTDGSVAGGVVLANTHFPSSRNGYLILETGTTGGATPSHGPHADGAGLVATRYVEFTRPAGSHFTLSLDWEFLNGESAAPTALRNDFLSIDVLDASGNNLVANVVFVDTGVLGGTPAYTNVPGAENGELTIVRKRDIPATNLGGEILSGIDWVVAPEGPKRAWIDLTDLTTGGSTYRLAVTVANGINTSNDSAALVDNIQLSVGQRNGAAGALQVLGSSHDVTLASVFSFDSSWPNAPWTPFEFLAAPGQTVSVRGFSANPGTGWAMAVGEFNRTGNFTPGFGTVNVNLSGPAPAIVFNGLAPQTASDALLGTISGTGTNFIEGQIPENQTSGDYAVQAAMADPADPPFFIALTAATHVIVDIPNMPVGTSDVLNGLGNPLEAGHASVEMFGTFSGGNWDFFGQSYQQLRVNSHGNLTFVNSDPSGNDNANSFVTAMPRIAALWDEYAPDANSAIRIDRNFDRMVVSWENMARDISPAHGTNVSVALYNSGVITVYFGGSSLPTGLTGISAGSLAGLLAGTPPPFDLTSNLYYQGDRGTIPDDTAFYEWFNAGHAPGSNNSPFDLMTLGTPGPSRITYAPDGTGGYTVYTGTR